MPKSSKPLNRPLRVQDCLRTRRDDLGVHLHTVGAAALYQRVLVGLGGKIGVGRYNSTTGRKSPTFVTGRQIYPENFALRLQSGLRQEVPWTWDPRALFLTMVRTSGWRDARSAASPGATSGPRDIGSGAFPFFAEPTCAPLGALSLIGSSNYNHLLFTELLITQERNAPIYPGLGVHGYTPGR